MAVSDKSVAEASTTGFSSVSTVSDDWQELTKSDYAKVIFSDLLCDEASGTVECKFQITDNVHEDPNDYVGLFRIGYEDLSQCFVSKMLSQTKCEDDGKLQRCVFTCNELPTLDDGFYQFLYVTRDQEICGASMPFLVKLSTFQQGKNSADNSSSENMDGGFLLVSKEMERKEHENTYAQPNTLTNQKKEEIAAWVLQNPDNYSVTEQIKDYVCTIDALQQSKDLTMREVIQLHELLSLQNIEMDELRNMLAAYEVKMKMSQCLQDEKNGEIAELKKSLTYSEDKLKLCLLHENQRSDQLSQVKNEFLQQEKRLKESLQIQDQQKIEIQNLKLELEEMKERHKGKKCQQEVAATEHSMETVIQKAQDMAHIVCAAINQLDLSDEHEVEQFYQLKIVFLIILSKINRATDLANTCERKISKTIKSVITKDAKENRNNIPSSSDVKNMPVPELKDKEPEKFDVPSSSNVESLPLPDSREKEPSKVDIPSSSNVESLLLTDLREKESAKSDILSATIETLPLLDSKEKEISNEDAPKKDIQRMYLSKAFESEALEHSIIQLPRLELISESLIDIFLSDDLLDTEDVAVLNRLTEKIIKKNSNSHEVIEVADDASEFGSEASDVSECSLSVKRDLLCVGRVMEALSRLSDEKNLELLIVGENEEDRNLIRRSEWNVLLQKCALHYQIELLLEHIEKQKEGIKKVSEKICDLLSECMVLKDEVSHSKTTHSNLQSALDLKNVLLGRMKGELQFKNKILNQIFGQKMELENRVQLADKTIDDLHARIVEGSNLYKQQYTEIQRLSKKLRKYQSSEVKTKSFKSKSLLSSETLDSTPSFEVVKNESASNISDSDTGEHMFEKASLMSNKEIEAHVDFKSVSECGSSPPNSSLNAEASAVAKKAKVQAMLAQLASLNAKFRKGNELEMNSLIERVIEEKKARPALPKSKKLNDASNSKIEPQKSSLATEIMKVITSQIENEKQKQTSLNGKTASDSSSFEDAGPSQDYSLLEFASREQFQEAIKDTFTTIQNPATSTHSISCYYCKKTFPLLAEAPPTHLMDHLEREHSMKMCPVCGHLFDEVIPPKYFHIHMERHFEKA